MIALAPNPLAPGFPRTWPDCQPAMAAIARHLRIHGANDDQVIIALQRDFPDLPALPGAAWRKDARYANVLAAEKMYLQRHPETYDQVDEPTPYELQVAVTAPDLVRLCALYGIAFAYDATTGELVLSRKLMVGGPCWDQLKRFKPDIVRILSGMAPS